MNLGQDSDTVEHDERLRGCASQVDTVELSDEVAGGDEHRGAAQIDRSSPRRDAIPTQGDDTRPNCKSQPAPGLDPLVAGTDDRLHESFGQMNLQSVTKQAQE